ncbi:hypothetical protein MLD38_013287 [Melastoma candidum]|uniref:Uncharacterized protein n=1 Tax=Melastoma candidum TaxID=119954 RepID=A0ACB9RAX9_9MYRT|nr:hypothetical protein MLD38_013287 [Melastoma candidum]
MGRKSKKEIMHLERESVIPILKHRLIAELSSKFDDKSERSEFLKFCKRVEYAIRAWYLVQFEDMMKLEQRNLSPEEIDAAEEDFLTYLMSVMEKSNFKIATDGEINVALSAQYRLSMPIKVDESKLDNRLLRKYFTQHPRDNLPDFADKYIVFRRGIGLDKMSGYFFKTKLNTIISHTWRRFLKYTGLRLIFCRRSLSEINPIGPDEICSKDTQEDLYVERIRIENMRLSISKLLRLNTIQEPTFERIIVAYRRASTDESDDNHDRAIYVKQFKSIPMADMEIVLPEKRNPGLTPLDWCKFIVSAAIGLITVASSLQVPKADLRVIYAILSALIGYCVKTYLTFQKNLAQYQNLITRCAYEKQLDSGRGTLLHLCDDVIQQEVKEVIISFFIMTQKGKGTSQEIDLQCERLMKEEFGQKCNFDVDDAIQKLEKLGIVTQDAMGNYSSEDLKQANKIIGMTTEEVVRKARDGSADDHAIILH